MPSGLVNVARLEGSLWRGAVSRVCDLLTIFQIAWARAWPISLVCEAEPGSSPRARCYLSFASALCSQYVIPMSWYIDVAVVRCSRACSRLPVRRYSMPRSN